MWNKERSLLLSKLFTMAFIAALAGTLVAAPWIVKWLIHYSLSAQQGHYGLFLATIYAGGVFAALLLYSLYRLLHNIGRDEVFVGTNVAHLRRISWCCFVGAGICVVSTLYYLPWLVVAVAAAFVGLVVRVVKNMVAQAVALKEENDFTI